MAAPHAIETDGAPEDAADHTAPRLVHVGAHIERDRVEELDAIRAEAGLSRAAFVRALILRHLDLVAASRMAPPGEGHL